MLPFENLFPGQYEQSISENLFPNSNFFYEKSFFLDCYESIPFKHHNRTLLKTKKITLRKHNKNRCSFLRAVFVIPRLVSVTTDYTRDTFVAAGPLGPSVISKVT